MHCNMARRSKVRGPAFLPGLPGSFIPGFSQDRRAAFRSGQFSACLQRDLKRENGVVPAISSSSPDTFASVLGDRIPQWLTDRLYELGYKRPTRIQRSALPSILPPLSDTDVSSSHAAVGNDAVLHAETGSGKTIAYLLPVLTGIRAERASTQALILVPTAELCVQVYKVLRRLSVAHPQKVRVHQVLSSGVRAKSALREAAPRALVGTVRDVVKLYEEQALRIDLVRILVVDEFDSILANASLTAGLQKLLSVKPREGRQTLLVSATVPQHKHFLKKAVAQRWTRAPLRVIGVSSERQRDNIDEKEEREKMSNDEDSMQRTPRTLQHAYALCAPARKIDAVVEIISWDNICGPGKVVVFVGKTRSPIEVANILRKKLHLQSRNIYALEGDERWNAMRNFREEHSVSSAILVAWEDAVRGLDVQDITCVLHLDIPQGGADAYLHNAGRAARLGRQGISILLVEQGEQFVISRIANSVGVEFRRIRG